MNTVKASIDEILESNYPLLPEGSYQAKVVTWLVGHFFVPRVILVFKITKGRFKGTHVTKFYNAKQVKTIGWRGKFVSKKRGALLFDFYRLNPKNNIVNRMDKIPMTKFFNKNLLIDVDTVESNYQKKSHPSQMRYSVVRDLRLIP